MEFDVQKIKKEVEDAINRSIVFRSEEDKNIVVVTMDENEYSKLFRNICILVYTKECKCDDVVSLLENEIEAEVNGKNDFSIYKPGYYRPESDGISLGRIGSIIAMSSEDIKELINKGYAYADKEIREWGELKEGLIVLDIRFLNYCG